MLLHKAIGHRFHAVLVDNGFLRHEEAKEVLNVKISTRLLPLPHTLCAPLGCETLEGESR
jgi:GMP synthase PP-ATPase subunit